MAGMDKVEVIGTCCMIREHIAKELPRLSVVSLRAKYSSLAIFAVRNE